MEFLARFLSVETGVSMYREVALVTRAGWADRLAGATSDRRVGMPGLLLDSRPPIGFCEMALRLMEKLDAGRLKGSGCSDAACVLG